MKSIDKINELPGMLSLFYREYGRVLYEYFLIYRCFFHKVSFLIGDRLLTDQKVRKMRVDVYKLEADLNSKKFKFTSEGRRGRIEKIVRFKEEVEQVYNLEFGDKKGADDIDDMSVSDNGDTRKVLATVAAAVEIFSVLYPDSWIYAEGSTTARTRLYQININRFFSEISSVFYVYGLKNNNWEEFKKGLSYQAFLLRRKNY